MLIFIYFFSGKGWEGEAKTKKIMIGTFSNWKGYEVVVSQSKTFLAEASADGVSFLTIKILMMLFVRTEIRMIKLALTYGDPGCWL